MRPREGANEQKLRVCVNKSNLPEELLVMILAAWNTTDQESVLDPLFEVSKSL